MILDLETGELKRLIMVAVAWSDKLNIGIAKVDEEHQKLVEILNQLDEAMRTGKGSRIMGEILSQLVEYTKFHFASEEELMIEAEYPKLKLHQAQHRQLVEKVEKLNKKFHNSGQRITKETMEFLKYWLTNHILVDDMALGKFVNGE